MHGYILYILSIGVVLAVVGFSLCSCLLSEVKSNNLLSVLQETKVKTKTFPKWPPESCR